MGIPQPSAPQAWGLNVGGGDETEADLTAGIVDVEVHQDDGLPRSQGDPAPEHRQRHRRAHEGGEDVVGAVTR